MSNTNPDRFSDQLVLYMLGELPATQCAEFQAHLRECTECRREYLELQNDAAMLALSTAGAAPPAAAKQRLAKEILRETRVQRAEPASRRWLVPVFLTLLLAVIVIAQRVALRTRIAELEKQLSSQQQELDKAQQIVSTLTSPDTFQMSLVVANSRPQPQGKVFYSKRDGKLLFFASHCPMVPEGRVYELWLIPQQGTPLPAGTFRPDARGMASVILPVLPANVEAKTFAITVEPDGGSPAPTSAPIMLGLL